MATEEEGSLEYSPTWAIAVVCTIFVLVSLAAERGIHYAGKELRKRNLKSLNRALEKMKEELMLLGFISILLTVFQPVIAGICMNRGFVDHMLPCKLNKTEYFSDNSQGLTTPGPPVRKLLTYTLSSEGQLPSLGRILSSSSTSNSCIQKGKVPFLSIEALHQLHIFIFAMAILHISYSCITMLLGRVKVHTWNTWEKEAHKQQFDYTKEILVEFVRKHAKRPWSSSLVLSWMVSFSRQFGRSVTRTDYLILRAAFISNHKVNPTFNFHKYVNLVLQDDFKKVVGLRVYMWGFLIIFLLLNIQGWHTYFWIAFIPLILVLVIGTKLQHIISTLASQITTAQGEMGCDCIIKPRDELFWFRRPQLILSLIHFILFQNAFEIAYFIWNWATFGFSSCFMDNHAFVVVRLLIGVMVQVLCSYSTLPLYALVTQMGSKYKAAIFKENFVDSLHSALARARKRTKKGKDGTVHEESMVNLQEHSERLQAKENSQQRDSGAIKAPVEESNAEIRLDGSG